MAETTKKAARAPRRPELIQDLAQRLGVRRRYVRDDYLTKAQLLEMHATLDLLLREREDADTDDKGL